MHWGRSHRVDGGSVLCGHLTGAAQWIGYAFGVVKTSAAQTPTLPPQRLLPMPSSSARAAPAASTSVAAAVSDCAAACCVGLGGHAIPRPDASTQVEPAARARAHAASKTATARLTHGPGTATVVEAPGACCTNPGTACASTRCYLVRGPGVHRTPFASKPNATNPPCANTPSVCGCANNKALRRGIGDSLKP